MTELIVTSSVLIAVITAMRHFLRGKISLRLQYALWALVLLRLLLPVSLFQSSISVMNAFKSAKSAYTATASPATPPALTSPHSGADAGLPAPSSGSSGAVTNGVTNETPRAIDTALLAQWIWAAGAAAVGGCLLISNLCFAGKLMKTRKAFQAPGSGLPVFTVAALPSPCLFGLIKPAIYLTPEIAEDAAKLTHVLAHETTHYRHGDHIWSALRGLCLALHWYNPLVWLAASLSRRDAELACDEGAIMRIGEAARTEYGRTLIGLTCEKRSAMDLLCCATTMTDDKAGIKERITLIARRPKMLIPALVAAILVAAVAAGCTFTGAKTAADPAVPLTGEEVAAYNKTFEQLLFDQEGNAAVNPLSHFLTSYYERPEDIALDEFLRYFPAETDISEAEFAALKASENWPFNADATMENMPLPIRKIPADSVNEVLMKYAGITLRDLSGTGADTLIYLEKFAAYYNFTSDFAAGTLYCTGGEKQGDLVRLFGDNATLTLKTKEDGFTIVSFLENAPASKELADAQLFESGGLTVAIPKADLDSLTVLTDAAKADSEGLLISVYEKKSYEDAEADYGEGVTSGLLFSIVRYTQAQYEQFLCSDGSGLAFFAKDDTYYYGFLTPTDVQFYRSGMTNTDNTSEERKAFLALNERSTAIRDDFAQRNRLEAYSDSEFRNREFTYDGEHLYAAYFPYSYQDPAQDIDLRDTVWTLVLSQPAVQGKTGIWCVERWMDENGTVYPYFPNANGLPAAQYYAEEQRRCDAGHKPGDLDPKQPALTFISQHFGHEGVTADSVTIQSEPPAAGKPIATADIDHDGRPETLSLDKSRIEIDRGDCVTLRVYDNSGLKLWSEDAGLSHAGWNSLYLTELDGKFYLLRYNPGMWQGSCVYTYTLFTIDGGKEKPYKTKTLSFDVNGTTPLDVPAMLAFADEINALLQKSRLLISSEGGGYTFGPAPADNFYERYSWLDGEPLLYATGDDLKTRLEKFSENAVSNREKS